MIVQLCLLSPSLFLAPLICARHCADPFPTPYLPAGGEPHQRQQVQIDTFGSSTQTHSCYLSSDTCNFSSPTQMFTPQAKHFFGFCSLCFSLLIHLLILTVLPSNYIF